VEDYRADMEGSVTLKLVSSEFYGRRKRYLIVLFAMMWMGWFFL